MPLAQLAVDLYIVGNQILWLSEVPAVVALHRNAEGCQWNQQRQRAQQRGETFYHDPSSRG